MQRWLWVWGAVLPLLAIGQQRPTRAVNLLLQPNTPALQAWLEAGNAAQPAPDTAWVSFFTMHGWVRASQLKAGSNLDFPLHRAWTLELTTQTPVEALAEEVAALPGVSWAEPNRTRQVHRLASLDPRATEQYYHPLIRTEAAHAVSTGVNVVVGVLDTGIDPAHPEFTGQLWVNSAEDLNGNGIFDAGDINGVDDDGNGFVDDVIGYDFADQPTLLGGGDDLVPDPDPTDDNGHGTAVAGVIGARKGNATGGFGVAPGAKLMTLRAFTSTGVGEDDDVARAIVYAADNGCRVLNLSFGDVYASQLMHLAVQYAYSKGVVLISSAGNASGDNLAYPSGFPEVMSIAGTAYSPEFDSEFLWPFSNYGTSTDLAAPADGILVPGLTDSLGNATYELLSGTSFAAPQIAGGAALLLALNPSLTPQQVRGALVSSADDLEDPGWDHFTGAGRLNLERLLKFPFGSTVEILSPPNDGGSGAGEVAIIGNVLHPVFESWALSWQAGIEDTGSWRTDGLALTADTAQQVFADSLARWDLSAVPEGDYTLRLQVRLKSGTVVEDRVRFVRDTTPPGIAVRVNASAWQNDRRVHLVTYRAADRAACSLEVLPSGAIFTNDKRVRNGAFVVPDSDLAPSNTFALRCTNAAGLQDTAVVFNVGFSPAGINPTGIQVKDYELPMGAYLTEALDLNGSGEQNTVVFSRYDAALNFGKLTFARFQGGRFSLADSINTPAILLPKAAADLTNNGRLELVANVNDSIYLYTQPAAGAFPTQVLATDFGNGRFPVGFFDPNNDGQPDLLARDANNRYVLTWNGAGFDLAATLPDTNVNFYGVGSPRLAVADVDNDGRNEVWFGDFDGNVYCYEHTGTGHNYVLRQVFPDPGTTAASEYLQTGDVDGDGLPEVVVATHSSFLRNTDFEYDPSRWHLRVLGSTGNDSFAVTWEDHLVDHFDDRFNALTLANLDDDPALEIVLSAFPRTYIYDQTPTGFAPRWFGGALNTHHVVGDFDNSGRAELALGQGDRALFIELSSANNLPGLALAGTVTGDASTRLRWNGLPGTATYRVLRQTVLGDTLGSSFLILSTQADTAFNDGGLGLGNTYAYFIQGISAGDTVQSNVVFLTLAPAAGLVSAEAQAPNRLVARFSGPVSDTPPQLARVQAAEVAVQQVVAVNDTALLLELTAPLAPGPHTVVFDSLYEDANGRTLDPGRRTATFLVPGPDGTRLFLTDWARRSDHTAALRFNVSVTAAALQPGNYAVGPHGRVKNVVFSDASQNAVEVTLEDIRLGAVGTPVTVRIQDFEGIGGEQIQAGAGDVAAFWEAAEGLDGIYAYPNPAGAETNPTFEGIRIAGLPAQAQVTILSPTGLKLRSLPEADADGGVTFDLCDYSGRRLKPGTYIYYVQTPSGATKQGTFGVVR